MNVRRPVLPVYATEHTVDCVHAPTRTRLVTSKISIAQGVPVMLKLARATSSAVDPAASTLRSRLRETVGSSGTSVTGAPAAIPAVAGAGSSEPAAGAVRRGQC